MSDDLRVYHPEEIIDAPFPGQDIPIPAPQAKPPTGTYVPTATKEKNFPKKRIATELIGQALNTRSKKILQEFELQQSGGLKIGDFKKGLTGDLRLTPNGLTARDQAGLTTFAIDGTTGDAIFKGTVQAGSVIAGAIISGDITVGGAGNSEGKIHVLDSTDVEKVTIDKDGIVINSGKLTIKDANEATIIDATGLVSTINFGINSTTQTVNQDITSTTAVDLDGDSFTVSVSRDVIGLVLFQAEFRVNDTANGNDFTGQGRFVLNIGGTEATYRVTEQAVRRNTNADSNQIEFTSCMFHVVHTFANGGTVVKAQAYIVNVSGQATRMSVARSTLSCITFGK